MRLVTLQRKRQTQLLSLPLTDDRQTELEPDVQGRGPEDGDEGSRDSASGKRKYADRDPESPGQVELGVDDGATPYAKKERSYFGEIDTDSPASYPKHVMVPNHDGPGKEEKVDGPEDPLTVDDPQQMDYTTSHDKPNHLLTPDSASRRPSQAFDNHPIYPRHQSYHGVYRAPSYNPEMEYGRQPNYGGGHYAAGLDSLGSGGGGGDNYNRPPRRWACDYCTVATFLSYEEACAHEEICARRHEHHYHDHRQAQPPRPPVPAYGGGRPPAQHQYSHHHQQPSQGSGLGALYHASQEVVTPPTPHHHQPNHWGSRGPPLPVLPHEQSYYRQGYYDRREDYHDPYYAPPAGPYQHHGGGGSGSSHSHHHQKPPQYGANRMLLAMPSDKDSLSDRQCYVRSEMVEIFAATEKDVAARHSKGAQKLVMGQVGIRCVHCKHLRPRDRAERAVCYPSSVSRIYQTVADMQRFHFEQCRDIPDHVRQIYKKLKTTRPRGVGSPQTYWVSSAKTIGLVDTEGGIRFDADITKEQFRQNSDMSVSTP